MYVNVVFYNAIDTNDLDSLWEINGPLTDPEEVSGVANIAGTGLDPRYLTDYDSEMLFNGNDASNDFGLWVTDGTAAGTTEIGSTGSTQIANANPYGLYPQYLQVYNNKVLFEGMAGVAGDQVPGLWVTNGTVAGTSEIGGAGNVGINGVDPNGFLVGNPDFTVFNGIVLFKAEDSAGNVGLWLTNGTAAGTYELAPISGAAVVGSPGSDIQPQFMTVLGGEVLFDGADQEDTPGSLWETNGTAAGTVEIGGEGNAGISGSPNGFRTQFASSLPLGMQPQDLTTYGGEVIFAAYDSTLDSGQNGYADTDALWISNGTASGTTEIGGLGNAQISGANPAVDGGIFWAGSIEYPDFTVYNGEVLFEGYDADGHAGLWETNGTAAGTVEIGGLNNAGVTSGDLTLNDSSSPDFTLYNGVVLFDALGSNGSGSGLWVTNGTPAGTYEWKTNLGYPGGTDFTLGTVYVSPANDFFDAGTSDLLFENTGGNYAMWQTNGTSVVGGGNVGSPGTGWTEVGTGDFNDANRADVLFEGSTGKYALWDMTGTSVSNVVTFGSPGTGWTFEAIGNFNNDGFGDILFENTAGDYAIWDTNGTAVVGGGNLGTPGTGWTFQGVGDFSTGVTSDILFESSGGSYALWDMNGSSVAQVVTFGSPGTGWTFKGIGDFYGNGDGDILFENTAGNYAVWETNGTSVVGGGNLGSPGTGWSFVAIGDYNGDGKSDILFQNASGAYAAWEMNGSALVNVATFGSPGAGWTLQHTA
jgi:ELWxxDGT repeat protein